MIETMREVWDDTQHEDVVVRWVWRTMFVIMPIVGLAIAAGLVVAWVMR